MPGLLIPNPFNAKHGADFAAPANHTGVELELLVLPPDPEARIADADAARADVASFSRDITPHHANQFLAAPPQAPALQGRQVFNAVRPQPWFASVPPRGVRPPGRGGRAHGADGGEPADTLVSARLPHPAAARGLDLGPCPLPVARPARCGR